MKKLLSNYKSTIILLVSIIIGAIVGFIFKEKATVLSPLGDIFLNLLLVVITPLIFLTITTSISKMKSPKRLGKIVGATFLVFIITSIIAVLIGFASTYFIKLVKPEDSEKIKQSLQETTDEETQENEVLNKIESLVPAKQILLELLNRYQIEMLDSSNCLTLAIYEFFSTLQRKGNESLLYEQYLLSKKTWESLIAYGIKTKEFNEVNAEAIIDIIIFSYQGVRLYSNLMLISPQIPENILYIIKNILLK